MAGDFLIWEQISKQLEVVRRRAWERHEDLGPSRERAGVVVFAPDLLGAIVHADEGGRDLLGRLDTDPGAAEHRLREDLLKARDRDVLIVQRDGGRLAAARCPLADVGDAVLLRPVRVGSLLFARAQFDAAGLTPREREVAEVALTGAAPAAIARALGVSPVTVKVHLGRIYAKTKVAGQSELIAHLLGARWTACRARRSGPPWACRPTMP